MRGRTSPGHRLDARIGSNYLLLLLLLLLRRRRLYDLHLLLQLLLLLILCRWCTGRPRRYNITDVSSLHKYVFPSEAATGCARDIASRRTASGTGNADDLGMLQFGRFRSGDNSRLGLL